MTGLFETMLAIGRKVVQRDEHFARLANSARMLGLPAADERAFRAAVTVQSDEELSVRCVYADGLFSATVAPIPSITLRRRDGARVVTLDRAIIREQPEHKLTSYAASRPAIPDGADEALFVDREGRILEGTTTNVFAIAGDTLITAADAILPGIVRAWVIANAARIVERAPTSEELRAGSFLTSSLTLLAPIVTLDGVACEPPGRTFTELREKYVRHMS